MASSTTESTPENQSTPSDCDLQSSLLDKLKEWGYCDESGQEPTDSLATLVETFDPKVMFLLERLLHDLSDMDDRSQDLEAEVASLTQELQQEREKLRVSEALNTDFSRRIAELEEGSHLYFPLEQLHDERENIVVNKQEEELQQWRAQSTYQLQELERMNEALRAELNRHTLCHSPEHQQLRGHIDLSEALSPPGLKTTSTSAAIDGIDNQSAEMIRFSEARNISSVEEEFEKLKEKHESLQNMLKAAQEDIVEKKKEIEQLSVQLEDVIKPEKMRKLISDSEPDQYMLKQETSSPQTLDRGQPTSSEPSIPVRASETGDLLEERIEKLQSIVVEQEGIITNLQSELSQKIEQLGFITDEKVVGEEALEASQIECSRLASLIKELDKWIVQLTALLKTRTMERDRALAAEKRETEARQDAEEELGNICNSLKEELEAAKDQLGQVQNDFSECQIRHEEDKRIHEETLSKLQNCQKQLETQDKDIEQLKGLITQLDLTREELVGKLKSTISEKQSDENRISILEKDLHKFIEEIKMRTAEIAQLHALLEALGKERDHFYEEMQAQASKIVEMDEENKNLLMELKNLKRTLQSTEQKLQTESSILRKSEAELASLREQLSVEQQSRKAVENQCGGKIQELQTLSENLAIVTSDSQAAKNELAQGAAERNRLLDDLNNLISRLNYYEQLILAKDKDEKEISFLYEQICEEHQQLKVAAIELDTQCQQQRYQLKNMEELIQKKEEHASSLEKECRKYRNDIKGLEKQADILSRSFSEQANLLDELHKEKTSLQVWCSSSKQTILELEQKQAALLKDMTSLESNNLQLVGAVKEKMQDFESLAARYRLEQERVREVEQLVTRIRAQEHQLQLEIKDSSSKVSMMRGHILSLEEQVRSLQKAKESQKDEILRLETLLREKTEEEHRLQHTATFNSMPCHGKENVPFQDLLESANSKARVHELEMRTISLASDLSKTASLYKDCFTRLQRAEAQCAEQRKEYDCVLSILSKVDDDRMQLQQKCRSLVSISEKKEGSTEARIDD